MNANDISRLILAVLMLAVTVGWGIFTVFITRSAIVDKEIIDIVGAAGASSLLGIFGTLTTQCWTFYFRKRPEEEKR